MKDQWEKDFEREYLRQKDRYWAIMAFGLSVTGLLAIGMWIALKLITG